MFVGSVSLLLCIEGEIRQRVSEICHMTDYECQINGFREKFKIIFTFFMYPNELSDEKLNVYLRMGYAKIYFDDQ